MNKLAHSVVDFKDARILKEKSDEKRLQPIYIRLFFEKAFQNSGGEFTELRPSIFRIDKMPDVLIAELKDNFKIHFDAIKSIQFCFDKQIFPTTKVWRFRQSALYQSGKSCIGQFGECIAKFVSRRYAERYSPYFARRQRRLFCFFVKSQIVDNRASNKDDSIADERLVMVTQNKTGEFQITSPAKFIDLHPPTEFTKPIEPPAVLNTDEVIQWSFEKITVQQFEDTKEHVSKDSADRRNYLESAFTQVIMDLQIAIQEMQSKVLLGDFRASDKIIKKQERINELIHKKESRLAGLDLI